jgi:hypothetical protein
MKNCAKPLSEKNKWIASGISAVIFIIIASPFMFSLTGMLFSVVGIETEVDGCPNWLGLFIHAIVFTVLVRLAMNIHLK